MSNLNILIAVTPQQQIEIENICVERNLSFSEYLIGLHKKETQGLYTVKNESESPTVRRKRSNSK